MESSTKILRRLLDERGVEWEDFDGEPTWAGGDGRRHYARQEFTFAGLTDEVTVYHLTPEQAIDATLGRGTCHETVIDHYWRGCGSCGYIWEFMYGIGKCERPCYCPNCGRKVAE